METAAFVVPFIEFIGFIWRDVFSGVVFVVEVDVLLARTAVSRLCCNGWLKDWDWVFVEENDKIEELVLLLLLLLLLLLEDDGDDGSWIGINVYLFWRSLLLLLLLLLLLNFGHANESSLDEFVGVFSLSARLLDDDDDDDDNDKSSFGFIFSFVTLTL